MRRVTEYLIQSIAYRASHTEYPFALSAKFVQLEKNIEIVWRSIEQNSPAEAVVEELKWHS